MYVVSHPPHRENDVQHFQNKIMTLNMWNEIKPCASVVFFLVPVPYSILLWSLSCNNIFNVTIVCIGCDHCDTSQNKVYNWWHRTCCGSLDMPILWSTAQLCRIYSDSLYLLYALCLCWDDDFKHTGANEKHLYSKTSKVPFIWALLWLLAAFDKAEL